ncbi:MAG: endonuclease/exonuclease/phosphatase family protein [Anaerolineales bacterium]
MKRQNHFKHRKGKRFWVAVFIGIAAFLFVSIFYRAKNYLDKNSPYYSGNYAVNIPKTTEDISVVTYNIWFAQDIDQAILDLGKIGAQRNLDIVLLQEMDESGVERIARELQLNYVYYPAAIEPTYHKNFGNAILSRWQITDSQKLILPHKSFSNRMSRIATRATIRIQDVEILVYCLHTESIFSIPQFREDQYKAVLNDIDHQAKLVIIGGDFNSFTKADAKKVEEIYKQGGFMRASDGSGNSLFKFGIGAPADHLFTRGFVVKGTGVLSEATASDHLPLWVTLKMKTTYISAQAE